MHAAWLLYAMVGTYEVDAHGLVIDWLSVPASVYFLGSSSRYSERDGSDWNQARAVHRRARPAGGLTGGAHGTSATPVRW